MNRKIGQFKCLLNNQFGITVYKPVQNTNGSKLYTIFIFFKSINLSYFSKYFARDMKFLKAENGFCKGKVNSK